MTVHVALLRAINLGPRNKLPMKDLAAFFSAAGAKDVRTFINSGNVLFSAPVAKVAGIDEKVRSRLASRSTGCLASKRRSTRTCARARSPPARRKLAARR
jgi:uncharacterized protein (DUF1697 family)